MPKLKSFSFDPINPWEQKRKRESESSDLYLKLLDYGYAPDEARIMSLGYAKTGRFEPITTREKPPATGIGPSNREPLDLHQEKANISLRSKGYRFNKETGKFDNVLPDQDVFTYGPDGKPVRSGSVPRGSKVSPRPKPQSEMQKVYTYDEDNNLIEIGEVPRGSAVKSPVPTDPIAELLKQQELKKVRKFKSTEEAESADLPIGSIVEVNGKRFRVE